MRPLVASGYCQQGEGAILELSRGNGQVSDITGSAGVTGRYLAKAIISDKSK